MYRGWTQTDYQNKHYNINQKDEGSLDDRGRDGGTNFILRINEQGTRLTLQEPDDYDDDDDDDDDVFIWEQTASCATYSINWLVFITEIKSVYYAVRTKSLTKAVCASSLKD